MVRFLHPLQASKYPTVVTLMSKKEERAREKRVREERVREEEAEKEPCRVTEVFSDSGSGREVQGGGEVQKSMVHQATPARKGVGSRQSMPSQEEARKLEGGVAPDLPELPPEVWEAVLLWLSTAQLLVAARASRDLSRLARRVILARTRLAEVRIHVRQRTDQDTLASIVQLRLPVDCSHPRDPTDRSQV